MLLAANNRGSAAGAPVRSPQPSRQQPPPPLFPAPSGAPYRSDLCLHRVRRTACCTAAFLRSACMPPRVPICPSLQLSTLDQL